MPDHLSRNELKKFRDFVWMNRQHLTEMDKDILADILKENEVLESCSKEWHALIKKRKEQSEIKSIAKH
jgi:hypothetical protein